MNRDILHWIKRYIYIYLDNIILYNYYYYECYAQCLTFAFAGAEERVVV